MKHGVCSCVQLQLGSQDRQYPILYFAVERNSPDVIRVLCEAGADPSLRVFASDAAAGFPVLSYAILSAEYAVSDTTDTIIALLSGGANPQDVPQDMWQDYIKAPSISMTYAPNWDKVLHYKWCTGDVRKALCRNLNLMQRYTLWKAWHIGRPTPRMVQCAEAWEMMPIFEVPYHIIGQHHATEQVQKAVLGHRLFQNDTPLVLLFTGPSGHGKTELARRMGSLLSLELLVVDCTEMRMETDIFGPKAPYYGSDKGTPLNNYLAEWNGKRAVVFLDEYEKTTDAVRKSMLLLFENGDYKDRRNHKQLDCSQIIWVLAANFGVEIINKFWIQHLKDQNLDQQKKAPFKTLEASLKTKAISEISAPVTGRISEIVPFFPFNHDEQAVTTYKFMRQLWNKVRAPINTEQKWFPGHSFINYVDDGRIATWLSKDGYNAELGARSLESAVVRGIQRKVADAFFGEAEKVTDSVNNGPLPKYEVRLVTISREISEIVVECNGVKQIQERKDEWIKMEETNVSEEEL